MHNTVMLIGRVKEISANKNIRLTLTMSAEEIVELNVFIPTGMKSNVEQYLHAGDIVGIKGHLKEDSKNHSVIVMTDKLSFLSSPTEEPSTDDEPSDDIDEEDI